MRMSTKGRYGLRIMLELAIRYGHGPVAVETIAESQGISANYIHLLTGSLKSAKLLRSVRGPKGGYELSSPPSTITALDVLTAAEGGALVECVGLPSICDASDVCVTRELWCEVSSAMESALEGRTLEQLAARAQSKRQDQPTCSK